MRFSLRSRSPEATRAAGRRLGLVADAAGGVLALVGPLGAGKTLLVQGLAEGLGLAPDRVASPTFVIANEYPLPRGGRLVHVDCYRVGSERELESAGLLDWLVAGSVVAVEWSDRIPEAWPADRLTLTIRRDPAGGSQRDLDALASGPVAEAWLARWRAAERAAQA